MVLPAITVEESGYLTCAKMLTCQPRLRIVLLGPTLSTEAIGFAAFVGATGYVAEEECTTRTLDAIEDLLMLAF